MEAIIFWIFALLALTGAGLLIFHKSPINSALSLILTLFATAGLFVLLHAGFIAVMQILVYAGAVMVLFVFIIMLLNLQREELGLRRHRVKKLIAMVLAGALGVKLASVVGQMALGDSPATSRITPTFGTIESFGMLLFTDYVILFEAISILILAAIVGSVMVAKTKV